METVNFESKIVTALTLLLAVYASPWSPTVRLAISAAAVVTVFRHDLWGRWGTRGRNQIEKRVQELDARDFIRKQQRLCCQRALGGCTTLVVGLYLWDLKMSTDVVRLLPPLDQGMFLVSVLAFNSAIQSFWQTDRNWVKKERDRLHSKLARPDTATPPAGRS
jgi:hypothetical protein